MRTKSFPDHRDPYLRCSRLVPESALDRGILHSLIRSQLACGFGKVDHRYIDQDRDDEPCIKIGTPIDSPEYWTEDGCLIGSIELGDPKADDSFMNRFEAPSFRIYFYVREKEYQDRTEIRVAWSLGPGLDQAGNDLPYLPVLNSSSCKLESVWPSDR